MCNSPLVSIYLLMFQPLRKGEITEFTEDCAYACNRDFLMLFFARNPSNYFFFIKMRLRNPGLSAQLTVLILKSNDNIFSKF